MHGFVGEDGDLAPGRPERGWAWIDPLDYRPLNTHPAPGEPDEDGCDEDLPDDSHDLPLPRGFDPTHRDDYLSRIASALAACTTASQRRATRLVLQLSATVGRWYRRLRGPRRWARAELVDFGPRYVLEAARQAGVRVSERLARWAFRHLESFGLIGEAVDRKSVCRKGWPVRPLRGAWDRYGTFRRRSSGLVAALRTWARAEWTEGRWFGRTPGHDGEGAATYVVPADDVERRPGGRVRFRCPCPDHADEHPSCTGRVGHGGQCWSHPGGRWTFWLRDRPDGSLEVVVGGDAAGPTKPARGADDPHKITSPQSGPSVGRSSRPVVPLGPSPVVLARQDDLGVGRTPITPSLSRRSRLLGRCRTPFELLDLYDARTLWRGARARAASEVARGMLPPGRLIAACGADRTACSWRHIVGSRGAWDALASWSPTEQRAVVWDLDDVLPADAPHEDVRLACEAVRGAFEDAVGLRRVYVVLTGSGLQVWGELARPVRDDLSARWSEDDPLDRGWRSEWTARGRLVEWCLHQAGFGEAALDPVACGPARWWRRPSWRWYGGRLLRAHVAARWSRAADGVLAPCGPYGTPCGGSRP